MAGGGRASGSTRIQGAGLPWASLLLFSRCSLGPAPPQAPAGGGLVRWSRVGASRGVEAASPGAARGVPSRWGPGEAWRLVFCRVAPRPAACPCAHALRSEPRGTCSLGPREDDVSEHHAHAQHPHLSADGPTSQTHPCLWLGHLRVHLPRPHPRACRASGSWRNAGCSPPGAVSFVAKATGHGETVPKAVPTRRPRVARAQRPAGRRAPGSALEPATCSGAAHGRLHGSEPGLRPGLRRAPRPGLPLLLRTPTGNPARPTALDRPRPLA